MQAIYFGKLKNQVIQSYFLKKRVVYQGFWGTSVQDWFVLSTSSSNSSIKQEETKQKNVESMVAKPNNSMWCCLDHCIPVATCYYWQIKGRWGYITSMMRLGSVVLGIIILQVTHTASSQLLIILHPFLALFFIWKWTFQTICGEKQVKTIMKQSNEKWWRQIASWKISTKRSCLVYSSQSSLPRPRIYSIPQKGSK